MHIRLTRSAEEDLVRGVAFYESQQQSLGTYFLDSLYADIDVLSQYAVSTPSLRAAFIARYQSGFRLPYITRSAMTSLQSWQFSIAGRTPVR